MIKLGVWLSNTRTRRDRLGADQLAALANLGVAWTGAPTAAGPGAARPTPAAARANGR